jgi:hypothetical protein
MKSNADKQVYLFLTVVFVSMTLGFSSNFIDFNHAKNALLGLALIIPALWMPIRAPTAIIFPRLLLAAFPVLLLSALIHGGGDHPVPGLSIRTSSHYLLAFLFLLYFVNLVPRDDQPKVLSNLLVTSTLAVSIAAWIQYFNLAPAVFPAFPQYDQRVYSVFGNQNLLGGYIAFSIPILVFRIVRDPTPKTTAFLALLLLLATCLISGSRSAWLAAVIGSACTIPYRSLHRVHYIFGAVLLLTVLLIALMDPGATAMRLAGSFTADDTGFHTRVWIWSGALTMLKDHFLFGAGPGMFQYWSPQYLGDILHTPYGASLHPNEIHTLQAHATPLDLTVEFGLAGAACCIAWIVLIVKNRRKAMWGSAIALTIYASLNTLTHSTPHLLAALLLCVSLTESPTFTLNLNRNRSRILTATLLVVVVLPLTVILGFTTLYPSYQLAQARQSFGLAENPETIREAYRRAAENTSALSQTHLEYGLLLLNDSPERALNELTKALSGIDTGEIYLALGQSSKSAGEDESALRLTEKGVFRWPKYFVGWEQRLHYSDEANRAKILEEAKRFLNTEQHAKLAAQFDPR